MSKIPPRDKQPRSDQSPDREREIADRYEGGHGSPYSPTTPETAKPGSPAIDEMKSRDTQDGRTDARRSRRTGTRERSGPPEPEESPAAGGDAAAASDPVLPQGKQRQRRSHRTLH